MITVPKNRYDVTKLGYFDRTIENCQVAAIPAGATPKYIMVELPYEDAPRVSAWWTGHPTGLAVNDYVDVRFRPNGRIQYKITGTSGGTAFINSVLPSEIIFTQPALVGRSDAGPGAGEEITVGAGLLLDAGELSADQYGLSYYRFSTTTTMADPGSGIMRFNNGTVGSVTAIALSELSTTNRNLDGPIALFDAGDMLTFISQTTAGRAARFRVTGPAVDNSTWWQVPVVHVESVGGLFVANALIEASISVIAGSGMAAGGWPFENILTVSTTDADADYDNVTAAIAAASAGDAILLDIESSSETVTVNKAVTIIGWSRAGTVFTNSMTITAAATLINIKISIASGTNSKGFIVSASAIFYNCEAVTSGTSTSRGIDQSAGNTQVIGGYYESTGAGTSYEIFLSGGTSLLVDPILSGGNYSGTVLGTFRSNLGIVTSLSNIITAANTRLQLGDGATTPPLAIVPRSSAPSSPSNNDIYLDTGANTLTGKPLLRARISGAWVDLGYAPDVLRVTNSSGATANAGDVGYFDGADDYGTTTTANAMLNGQWCVVLVGGANGAAIYVARRGRVTVNYTGTAPSDGDYLVTSTSAGLAGRSTTVRPEIFAQCVAAGSGGTVEALLLTGRSTIPLTSTNLVFNLAAISGSDFVATQNGAVSGNTVTYNAPSSGNENTINPASSSELAKLVLYNTTRGTSAKISTTNTGTNVITVTDSGDISAWQSGDTLTARSQTNTDTITSTYFYDFNVTSSEVPALATMILLNLSWLDSAGNITARIHPFEAGSASKRFQLVSQVANISIPYYLTFPLINRRFQMQWSANGSGTATLSARLLGVIVAAP